MTGFLLYVTGRKQRGYKRADPVYLPALPFLRVTGQVLRYYFILQDRRLI